MTKAWRASDASNPFGIADGLVVDGKRALLNQVGQLHHQPRTVVAAIEKSQSVSLEVVKVGILVPAVRDSA